MNSSLFQHFISICLIFTIAFLELSDSLNEAFPRRFRRKLKRQSGNGGGARRFNTFCSQNGEGFHPHPDDCTKFVRCVNFGTRSNGDPILTRFDFDCAPGTIYDRDLFICNHPDADLAAEGCRAKFDYEIIGLPRPEPIISEEPIRRPYIRTTTPRGPPGPEPIRAPPTSTTPSPPEPDADPLPPPKEDCNCHAAGTVGNTPDCDPGTGACKCKKNTLPTLCDSCSEGHFSLEAENEDGCSPCFCSGHSSKCESATGYNQVPVRSVFAKGFGKWTAEDQTGNGVPIEWFSPSQDIGVTSKSDGQQIYFLTPNSYLGEQRRSFNRNLQFTLYIDNEKQYINSKEGLTDADIILEGSGLKVSIIAYIGNNPLPTGKPQNYTVKLHPSFGWVPKLSEAQFIKLLSNLTAIKIRGTHTPKGTTFLDNVFLETARKLPGGPPAPWVEECVCPEGYSGSSCETCAEGFMRATCGGDLLTKCVPCDCSKPCPEETGCGCPVVAAGPTTTTTTTTELPKVCECSLVGSLSTNECEPGTSNCKCKKNAKGPKCDSCAEGSFGLEEANREGCTECFCFGHAKSCHSATDYNFLPVRSVFAKGYGKWTTEDSKGNPIQIKWSKPGQDVTATSTSDDQQIYFVAPPSYLGEQRRSFNKYLNYTFYINNADDFLQVGEPDIIFEGNGLRITKVVFGDPNSDQVIFPTSTPKDYSFLLNPAAGWEPKLSESQFRKLLSNLTALKIRGTLTEKGTGYLDNVFLETARKLPGGEPVPWVEECDCPTGYSGVSCEDCADGFMRSECGGDSLVQCIPCDCSKKCAGESTCNCP